MFTDDSTHKMTYTGYFVHVVIGYTLLGTKKTVLTDEHILSNIQSYWVTFLRKFIFILNT